MAEVAIPIVGLGMLYIMNEQENKKTKKEGFENQKTDFLPKDSNTTKIPEPKNSNLEMCSYNGSHAYQDKYFNQNTENTVNDNDENLEEDVVNQFNPSNEFNFKSLTGNVITSEEFKEGVNMKPFFGSKVRGNIHTQQSEALLDSHSGAGTYNIKKQEMAPLFKPQKNMDWNNGMPNESDFIQSRMNPAKNMANVKPWEEERVAPGLNKGYTCSSGLGFNTGLEARDCWKPKDVDELRVATNPKESYAGVVLPGSSAVKNRGITGKQEKYRPDTYYINTPERYIVDRAAEKMPMTQSKHIMKNVKKCDQPTNTYGLATGVDNKREPSRDIRYEESKRMPSCAQPISNAKTLYNNGANDDHGRSGYLLDGKKIIEKQSTDFGQINGTIRAWAAPIMDALRPTRKTNVVGNPNQVGNIQYTANAPEQAMINPYNKPRVTMRQTTENRNRLPNAKGVIKEGYNIDSYAPMESSKQCLSNERFGVMGGTPITSASTDYASQYNAQINDSKEKTMQSRTNSGNMSLLNSSLNLEIKKSEDDRRPHHQVAPQNVRRSGVSKENYGIGNRQPISYNQQCNDRINPNLLKAFKQNPYTQSLHSVA